MFVKELELALLERRAHLAVHSLKDVPMHLEPEFSLTAVLTRDDPRDCMVSNHFPSLDDLPDGSRVGTSSLRRELMLRARFPRCRSLRCAAKSGPVLQSSTAVSSMRGTRSGWTQASWLRFAHPSDHSDHCALPAPGQGALGIEVRVMILKEWIARAVQ